MNFLESNKRVFWILFTIYFVVNIPFLINFNGIYWDDWTLVGHSIETLNRTFFGTVGYAGYITSCLHYFMINELGVYSYRLFTFILLFLSGWFVFKILSTISIFSLKDKFFISVLFLVIPLYSAKIALIDFPYTLATYIFFFSFYLLSKYLNNLGILKRVIILSLFFLSFRMNSVMVFYAIVLMYMYYILYETKYTFIKNSILFIKTKIDFLFLPLSFFMVKSIWFVSSGAHEIYNVIEIRYILSIDMYFQTFLLSFIEPIQISIQNISFLIFILFFGLLLLSNLFLRNNNDMTKKDFYLFILGFVFFILGSMPYIAVGKVPSLNDWESRYQVLLPLGFSFILYYGIQIISNLLNFKIVIKYFVYLILIFSFMIFHIKEQIKYNIDYFYQQSIIENFRDSKIIKKNTTFIFNNKLENSFVADRELRFYELNGIAKFVFDDDTRLFVKAKEDIEKYKIYKNYLEYNFSNWIYTEPIYFEIKNNESYKLHFDTMHNLKLVLKLKYLEFTNKEKFKKEVKSLVSLDIE